MALVNIPRATLHRASLGKITQVIKANLVDASIGVPQAEVDKLALLAPYNNSVVGFFAHVAALLTAVGATTIPYKGTVNYYRNDINAALKIIRTNMWTKAGLPIPDNGDFVSVSEAEGMAVATSKTKSKRISKRKPKKKVK